MSVVVITNQQNQVVETTDQTVVVVEQLSTSVVTITNVVTVRDFFENPMPLNTFLAGLLTDSTPVNLIGTTDVYGGDLILIGDVANGTPLTVGVGNGTQFAFANFGIDYIGLYSQSATQSIQYVIDRQTGNFQTAYSKTGSIPDGSIHEYGTYSLLPANDEILHNFKYQGNNSINDPVAYGRFTVESSVITSGSETGMLKWYAMQDGVEYNPLSIDGCTSIGLYVGVSGAYSAVIGESRTEIWDDNVLYTHFLDTSASGVAQSITDGIGTFDLDIDIANFDVQMNDGIGNTSRFLQTPNTISAISNNVGMTVNGTTLETWFKGSSRFMDAVQFESSVELLKVDNGDTGTIQDFYHNSASSAVNDKVGGFNFYGNDSTGSKTKYANLSAFIVDPTNSSEDGGYILSAIRAGVETEVMRIGSLGSSFNGMLIGTNTLPSPSGSNPTRAVFWNTALNSNALLVGAGGGSGNAMTICDANTNARQIRFGYISTYAIVDSVNTPASGMLFRTTGDYTLACGNASRSRFATFSGTELATVTYQKRFGVGTGATVEAAMHAINVDVPQMRLGYDFTNYLNVQVDSSGNATFDLAGTSPEFNFSKGIDLTQTVTTENETTDTTITIKVNGSTYKLLAKAI